MKRTALVLPCLAAFALLLSGCQNPQENIIPEVTQFIGPAATQTPTPSPAPEAEPAADFTEEDALAEEEGQVTETLTADFDAGLAAQTNLFNVSSTSSADATAYPYTGSTPIPLEPIDAPTPTPQAPLVFTYISYSPATVGVTFEAPAGWIPDETYNEVFTLTEPESQMKNGQLGILNVYAVPVISDYTQAQLEQEIKQRLNTIGSLNFVEWKPSYTATRYLLGSMGVYAQYTGKLVTGVEVGGRIHAVTIDNVLYCIQITYPLVFRNDYLDIFAKLRETIKRVQ
ncbi:MAG: hypothetical protein IH607_07930 [Firmicutes bacterium]|nr:hypothetical protein [Bacillota bacterium]